jgi:hypothetical protein
MIAVPGCAFISAVRQAIAAKCPAGRSAVEPRENSECCGPANDRSSGQKIHARRKAHFACDLKAEADFKRVREK